MDVMDSAVTSGGLSLRDKYSSIFSKIRGLARAPARIDETNVYQASNEATLKIMLDMAKENLLPGSSLGGIENFKAFYDALENGKRALILMEHYSNMDLPLLFYLLNESSTWGKDLSSRIVAIAGMKLNEEDPYVRAFAEAFSRVVIYPTRSLQKLEGKELKEEEQRARRINLSAMHAMDDLKRQGKAILVFPSGTRYRPGQAETKRGLKEIDSYLRLFDVMILVTINGACLHIDMEHPDDMLCDIIAPARVKLTASPLMDCKAFRKGVLASLPQDESEPKQRVIDKVMAIFDQQHEYIKHTDGLDL